MKRVDLPAFGGPMMDTRSLRGAENWRMGRGVERTMREKEEERVERDERILNISKWGDDESKAGGRDG